MTNVIQMKGAKPAPRGERSRMETLVLTAEIMEGWELPYCQRPLKVNAKVRAVAEEIKDTEVIPGILTLGELSARKGHYFMLDGQHRREAGLISGCEAMIADVRIVTFDSMKEMGEEFVRLNSALVRMTPDDVLRAMTKSLAPLDYLVKSCPFVGFGHVRRGSSSSPLLSASAVLRCWSGSARETPTANSNGASAHDLAHDLTQADAENLVVFLQVARSAWGSDLEYAKLWGSLNLCLCMWLWRRLVLDKERGVKRYTVLTQEQFRKCLMSVSAARDYSDWLVARVLGERDRSPCYRRLRTIFVARLKQEKVANTLMPSAAWVSN